MARTLLNLTTLSQNLKSTPIKIVFILRIIESNCPVIAHAHPENLSPIPVRHDLHLPADVNILVGM